MLITDFTGMIASGRTLTADEITLTLDPDEFNENRRLKDWAISSKIITKPEWDKAIRNIRIRERIGSVPLHVQDFVCIIVIRDALKAKLNGMIEQNPIPYLNGDPKAVITRDTIEGSHMVRQYVRHHFPPEIGMDTLQLRLRNLATELGLPYSRDAIHDALQAWFDEAAANRRYEIENSLGGERAPGGKAANDADQMWRQLASASFDEDPEFVIAVLKKFIWQVKRKLAGMPITNHLMPVLQGPQGCGKTTFVNAMLAPVREITADVDFKMVEDDRNIDLWKNAVMFLDEMGHATKSDADSIKSLITADTISRRPMRSNSMLTVKQHSTFIGCSNKAIGQIIKDPTGIRRFAELVFASVPDWTKTADVNWLSLWASVGSAEADPMLGQMSELKDRQEASREKGRVEMWLDGFMDDPDHKFGDQFMADKLFKLFSAWEIENHPHATHCVQAFGHELNRLMKASVDVAFEKKRTNRGIAYVYKGGKPRLTLV